MKRWIANILLILFILVFLGSGYVLLSYFWESKQQKDSFQDLADIMESASVQQGQQAQVQGGSLSEGAELSSLYVQIPDPETGETVELLPEFEDLYTINNDIIGWIHIPTTEINYPVMQTPNRIDYYLRRDYYERSSSRGCIYVRESCDVFIPSDNVTIYGHRMKDGTMFADLANYTKKSFWEEHRYVTFNTLLERHTYEIFAVFKISSDSSSDFPYHQFEFAADEADFQDFVDNCKSRSLYDTGITPTYGDKLITLSTCDYSLVNGRLVVVAVRTD